MGKTLHNKIQLGRSSLMDSRRWQLAMALGVLAGFALTWVALRAWH
jgi:hypothetical protein